MDVEIEPSSVSGTASAPPSKSYTHRAILAAGYGKSTIIHRPLGSADTRATGSAVEVFGGAIQRPQGENRDVVVSGFEGEPSVPDDVVDCENSGTTMRLTTATAALVDGVTVLTGDESLRDRPQGPLLDAIERLGGSAESTRENGQAPLIVEGPIEGGSVSITGDVSSQFVTALLMAGAVTDSGVEIDIETELKSAPYVDITIEVLDDFGVSVTETDDGFAVEGGQTYHTEGGRYTVPGDFSSISYLLAAGAVAAPDGLQVHGAMPSAQGDTAIVDVLEEMGADLEWHRADGVVEIAQSDLEGVEVSVADTPDLLPTIAVLGAIADGTTRIVDAEHVRYKETDRVTAMAEELERMGAEVTEQEDELHVHGGESDLVGAKIDSRSDHRVIMSMAVAGLVADGTTTITSAEHVDVSYPSFFDVLENLGADVEQRDSEVG